VGAAWGDTDHVTHDGGTMKSDGSAIARRVFSTFSADRIIGRTRVRQGRSKSMLPALRAVGAPRATHRRPLAFSSDDYANHWFRVASETSDECFV
jgi:hypothetical protein